MNGVTVTLTTDRQNQFPRERLCLIWRNFLQVFLSYCVHENKKDARSQCHWPLKCNQFIVESKWLFIPNVRKFRQGILKLSCWREWDGQTDNPETLCCRPQLSMRGSIKRKAGRNERRKEGGEERKVYRTKGRTWTQRKHKDGIRQ